jgi:hypothetical protein
MLVVARDPVLQFLDPLGGTALFLEPQAFLVQGAHDPCCVRVACRIVIAGKGLLDPQGPTGPYERRRGRLTPVITHQGKALVSGSSRKLVSNGPVQGRKPMRCCASQTGIVTDDRFGVPIERHHDRDPATPRTPGAIG